MDDAIRKIRNGIPLSLSEKKALCNDMLTEESKMEALILRCFSDEDYRKVYERRIGGGQVGGKACGMLAAHMLIKKNLPELYGKLRTNDSYYLGTQVFASYLSDNGCSELWANRDQDSSAAEELTVRLSKGSFSEETEQGILKPVRHYGDTPVIVRSSSMLEDGYGNAFSGKYESVFCVGRGGAAQRAEELKQAVRTVYASMLRPSALEYRRKRGLTGAREEMALLIQPVEGHRWGNYYFPLVSGMGCSYNPYKWMETLNPNAGMLRLVVGIATKAVRRSQKDYPRMVGLERPGANLYTSVAERHKFSQRYVDVIDLEEGNIAEVPLEQVIPLIPQKQCGIVFSRDYEAEASLARNRVFRKVYFADCDGVVADREFTSFMSELLQMLEKEYGSPVDVEYALDFDEARNITINLYQCRPVQKSEKAHFELKDLRDEDVLFDVDGASVRKTKTERIDIVVWVDPQKYYECLHSKKPEVAFAVGCINRHFQKSSTGLLLLAPGRIGTSSPELGVPVDYADISNFKAICEVAYSKAGYLPELSYGSHMFQDLVEADMYYGAIEEKSTTRLYRPEMLKEYENIFLKLFPDMWSLENIVKVFDVRKGRMRLLVDAEKGRAVCAADPENKR